MPAVSTHDPRRATQVTLRAVMVVSVLLTIVFVSFFLSPSGKADLDASRKRVTTLRSDIHRLEADNARLHAEIDSAKKSTYAVERIAREDLGMAKSGEVTYLLPKK